MRIRDLIKALGGPAKVGKVFELQSSAVTNWYGRGIPPVYYAPLWRLARERGVDWTPPGFEAMALDPAPAAKKRRRKRRAPSRPATTPPRPATAPQDAA